MTDPTEAISEAHRQIVSVIQHMVELKELVPYNLHRAARNLKYALDAMEKPPRENLGSSEWNEAIRRCKIDAAYETLPEVRADPLREALEPFVTAAKVIAARPQDYDNRIVSIGGLIDACDLTKLHFERLLAALAAPQPPARETISDTRWAVNILLEKIAEKFDGWDTMDMWRSDAAAVVRGFKHDVSAPPPPAPITTEKLVPVGTRETIARIIDPKCFGPTDREIAPDGTGGEMYHHIAVRRRSEALAKADAILALSLPAPITTEQQREAIAKVFEEYRKALHYSFDNDTNDWVVAEKSSIDAILALSAPVQISDFEQVFIEACDEIRCTHDNEALLQAIVDLKNAVPPVTTDRAAVIEEDRCPVHGDNPDTDKCFDCFCIAFSRRAIVDAKEPRAAVSRADGGDT